MLFTVISYDPHAYIQSSLYIATCASILKSHRSPENALGKSIVLANIYGTIAKKKIAEFNLRVQLYCCVL